MERSCDSCARPFVRGEVVRATIGPNAIAGCKRDKYECLDRRACLARRIAYRPRVIVLTAHGRR